MSIRFQNVKRYKRGATWSDGETRTCTRCRIEKSHGDRLRANAAVVVANTKSSGSKFIVPVGYCDEHTPEELKT